MKRILEWMKLEKLASYLTYGKKHSMGIDAVKDYDKKVALQLFNELSDIYIDDICKHIDLCRRYPQIANEWEQSIIAYLNSIERPEDYNEDEEKERRNKLYEKITNTPV